MTRLIIKDYATLILLVAALIISQQAGKKHSIVFKTLPIHFKTNVSTYMLFFFQIFILLVKCFVSEQNDAATILCLNM